jgi:predicted TIM-barrel fold metal-dependent hydrolase
MTEPGDLWVERLDRKFRDNAPKVIKREASAGSALGAPFAFVGPGFQPLTVAGMFAAGRSGEELREHMRHGYEAARPGGWDPVERLKDQDLDGVSAEVLYASLGIALLSMTDTELQQACMRVYNDWLAEFCSHAPNRLAGIGLYSLRSLPDVSEIERFAKKGLKGILVLASNTIEIPYSDPSFDPLWRTASETNMPISLPMKPGEYVRRNIWATFQDDPLGPGTWKFFGEDNYMWASDFPHADSTFPKSVKTIEENFSGVPAEVRGKIVFNNANRLYGLGLN